MTEIGRRTEEAHTMRASCTICMETHDLRVSAVFTQATRTEPYRFLGFYGYCPQCDCRFSVPEPQLVLS